jgi:hypothetical protein
MASFDINAVARRVQHTVGSSDREGPYAFSFQVNSASELAVYQNDTLLTESTQYNSSIGSTGSGTITFIDNSGSGGTDYTPTAADVITIIGDQPLSRTTSFQTGQVNQPATLETEFDNVLIRQQQLKEITDRSIQLKPSTGRTVTGSGTSGPLQFPYDSTVANNVNRIIKFDSNGTALELGSTTTNIDALAAIASDITTVSAIASDVAAVQDIAANVTTVAGISANVTSVAGVSADVTTVAGISANVTTVAGISANVTTLAPVSANITTLAPISANITTLAPIAANVTTVAGISADVTTVAGVSANVTTVAGISANVTTVAGVSADVTTVASNVAGVTSFAERYRVTGSDPSSDNDAGDLNYNTSSNALKYWDGSAWNTIASTYSIDTASDTNITSPADGAMLLYDTDTSKWIDNVMSGDATMADTGAVTIADDAITLAKMAAGTEGNIISYDASGNPVAVATGSAGQVLTSAGAGSPPAFAEVEGFPSGTKMLFNQTAAPTGWTKDTTNNDDSALRVVTGTTGTGGSVVFSTAMATPAVAGSVGLTGDLAVGNLAVSISGNVSDTTLSEAQIPSHFHGQLYHNDNSPNGGSIPPYLSTSVNNWDSLSPQEDTRDFYARKGGGGAHNHAHNIGGSMSGVPGVGNLAGSLSSSTATINVKYVDVIVAAKD